MSHRHRVELRVAIPEALRQDVREKLPYCAETISAFELDQAGTAVEITVSSADEVASAADKVQRLVDGMIKGWRPVDKAVLWSHRVTPPQKAPVWDELVARGLVHAEGPGQIALMAEAARLAEALDRRFVAIAYEKFDAEPHRYPTMLAMDVMDRCHYFASFPQHVTFAPHLRQDVDGLKAISTAKEHESEHAFLEHLRPPRHVLSPAVCFHTYQGLADKKLERPRIVTAAGRCFRYEASNFSALERVWDFTMREIVLVGPQAWVDELRERGLAEAQKLVTELGLDAWIETASDPFFLNNFVAKKYFQLMTKTKYELQLGLPADGRSLAAASFNLHQDFFGKSFGIAIDGDNGFASTGCIAFGLERWVWAIYSQFGADSTRWPAAVHKLLEA
jgi:seryl-tRNA synthetase